jgi:hypothetical protein
MTTKKSKGPVFERSKPTIVIENQSTLVTDKQIRKMMSAFRQQILEDFRPAWGLTARLVFNKKPEFPHMGLVIQWLHRHAGQRQMENCLGT